MRKMLFRGKGDTRHNNSEWIEGFLIQDSDGNYQIFHNGCCRTTVLPETVGQYTGATDKTGKKIFEGDIISFKIETLYNGDIFKCSEVKYDDEAASFYIAKRIGGNRQWCDCDEKQVIGTVWDNPELLEGC